MRKINSVDGVYLYFADLLAGRYFALAWIVIASFVWFLPVQGFFYNVFVEYPELKFFFKNIYSVLDMPYDNPTNVSGALLFLNIIIVIFFLFFIFIAPSYVRALYKTGARGRLREILYKYKWYDYVGLNIATFVFLVFGFIWVFSFNGEQLFPYDSCFYKYPFVLMLINISAAWFVIYAYILIILLLIYFNVISESL